MSEKIIGYVLVAAGIVIIFFALFNVYGVFANQATPIQLFNFEGISFDMAEFVEAEQREQLSRANIDSKTELVSADVINSPLNYAFHLLFMGFITSVGLKIAKIGTMLVRPIKVNLKSKKTNTK